MGLYEYMLKNYEEKNSIELLCVEIRNALKNKMYFSALIMSLIIPDVLGKLEYKGNKKYYATWYDKYVRSFIGLTHNEKKMLLNKDIDDSNTFNGNQCYNLRCSLFHNIGIDIEERTKIKEFVIQLSEEPFVRGRYAGIEYEDVKVDVTGEIYEESKFYQLYISANEVAKGIVDATELYMRNNKEKIEKINKIKINKIGGIVPKCLFTGLRDE